MKLQLALDTCTLREAMVLVKDLQVFIDIIEIGTPFLLEEGLHTVKEMRRQFPDLEIFADTKIMDAGKLEAEGAFKAGADYVSVLGVTNDATVKEAVETANMYDKKVVIDMMNVQSPVSRVSKLGELGADAIAVHTGVDQQKNGRTPIKDLIELKPYITGMDTFIAGGINRENVGEYILQEPDVIIIGSGILTAADHVREARWIRNRIPLYHS
ncbi:MAG: orotidine 5'-phosphate decarboxylase [Sphaerochaetaceae bacterium]|nr:orotidine 5'-phosphate decarboxylase [Sphaerochaetaceae bacterium]